ncbi:MAG: hypothetical protein KJO51_07660 [Gramella sp.]|nr:hypothetical protein [Christiangramia sp.]
MNKFFLLILFIIATSCKSDRDAESSATNKQDTTAFQQKLKLENISINDVKNNAGAIAQIMESLKNSVPDSLNSVAVEARLNVVNTKAQLLKQYAGRQDPDAEDIAQTTKELHLEFNNLKLQMNEIFLKTLEEFEKELDDFEREEKEGDSLSEDF